MSWKEIMKKKDELKIGEIIRCRDYKDMIDTSYNLYIAGITTKLVNKRQGIYMLEVKKVEEKK